MAFVDVLTHSSILRRRAAGNPPTEIEIDAYSSWEAFVASIEDILKSFGEKYVINFV